MQRMRPLVSVIVPTYQSAAWLPRALDSALGQTLDDVEVLVLDDGSTDDTAAVLGRYAGRVVAERTANHGARVARNRLLARARGEWVQFLDADDVLDSDKLEQDLQALAGRPDADVLVAPARFEDGSLCNAPRDEDPWIALIHARLGITSSNLWRRASVIDAGGFDEASTGMDEYRLLARLLARGATLHRSSTPRATYRRVNPESCFSRRGARNELLRVEFAAQWGDWLRDADLLTPERREAFGEYMFERSRSLWSHDPAQSRSCYELAVHVDPALPERLRRDSRLYGQVLRVMGFERAQQLDAWTRRVRGLRPR